MKTVLKKTNILFHSIREYSNLKKIISDKGFKASYADEIVDGYKVKILMVSFSNVALLESRTQINYGDFSVGLTKEWAKRKKLEPVIYTYENSEVGTTFLDIMTVAGRRQEYLKRVNKNKLSESIRLDFSLILDNTANMLMYVKPTKVYNNEGEEFIAYNDREWRFVHKHGEINPLIWEKNYLTNKPFTEYKNSELKNKPFTESVVLSFVLADLKYIVVEKKNQKKEIFESLSDSFDKDEIIEKIINGDLEILSRDTMWDNL
jgi:hypothetical protein